MPKSGIMPFIALLALVIVVGCSSSQSQSASSPTVETISKTADPMEVAKVTSTSEISVTPSADDSTAPSSSQPTEIHSPTIAVPTSTIIPPTQIQLPTESPTATPLPVKVPTAAPPTPILPSATPTLIATSEPTETPATATPTPTSVPVATSTFVSAVTSTPAPTVGNYPTATLTPDSQPDSRYGVIATGELGQLGRLGVSRFLELTNDYLPGPIGEERVVYIKDVSPVPLTQINNAVATGTGKTWYVIGEPNAHGVSVSSLIVGLHDTYAAIRAADPQAKITSPSALNFDYMCDNTCGGYASGRSWQTTFIQEYINIYGVEPPVDYWAIDNYPIRWDAGDPITDDSSILKSDLIAYRAFIDTYPGQVGKPIIITELGIHWGFNSVTFSNSDCAAWYPDGGYNQTRVEAYFGEVFTWLEQNAASLNILEWYVFPIWRDLAGCHADGGYGMTMFDNPTTESPFSDFGQFFYNWIRGHRP